MSIVSGVAIALCFPHPGYLFLHRIIPHSSSTILKSAFSSRTSAVKGASQVFETKQARRLLSTHSTRMSTMAEASDNITEQKNSYIDKLALILVNEKRQQLVARSKGKKAFFTPGGKREGNESDTDALCRECKEELTISLKRESIKKYGVFQAQAFGKPHGTMVRMTCYTSDFTGDLKPQNEVEELRWIDSSCARELLTETGIMIQEDLKKKGIID